MPLFQKSVVKKYINELDNSNIDKAFAAFQAYFHNAEIQQNIRQAKEEQFQEGFMRELFVDIFGYVLNPQPDFNLTTELKNIANSKKADGAILKEKQAIAVIELKSTQTTDLDSVESQAFGYKNHHPECRYVITSNFEKLRFYIQNAVEYLEFDLFTLDRDAFALMWLCLAAQHLLTDTPLRMKEASVLREENVTQELYADYAEFRSAIFNNMVQNNPQTDKLLLFKKTQKLLDRFLFIFFAEDRLLLPPNSISTILKQWETLKEELDAYAPLYDRFKKYFGYIHSGYKGKRYDVYPYNGGLFAPDTLLDSIKLDDDILYRYTKNLSAYDFETDVDVNILGHIFEHSLGEIENVQAEIKGEDVDRRKSKRKKDGIFYTPKYITKYIVENTIGRLCEEKRRELEVMDEDYAKGRKNRKKETIKKLDEKLDAYRSWLLSLTILDPACGSGAFLNQALEFLIDEHRKIDDLRAQLFDTPLVLSDITNDILEKNIYGVDLNEESVEIAKLSLWLRTAQKGRKLNNLSNNIKCGNSLIDDPAVAGDKAFNWHAEFPDIFANGGFDVVIGNPPYVRSRELFDSKEKSYYINNFETVSYQIDLYKLFIEKSCKLLNPKGFLSFITPSVFLTNDYDKPLREYLLSNFHFENFATSDKDVFQDASVRTVIFVLNNFQKKKDVLNLKLVDSEFQLKSKIPQQFFIDQNYLINDRVDIDALNILSKLNKNQKIKDIFSVKNGIKVRKDLLYNQKANNDYKPFVLGKNIYRYEMTFDNIYIHYLQQNEKLYTNQAFRTPDIFEQEKLVVRQILGYRIITSYDDNNIYTDQTTYVINNDKNTSSLKYLLCQLNSKLLNFYFQNSFSDNKITFPKIKRSQILELPFIDKKEKAPFVSFADQMINLNQKLREKKQNFTNTLNDNYSPPKLSKKLQLFYKHDFATLLAELKKQKISIPLAEQSEWKTFFEEQQQEIKALQADIAKTDAEIDRMVYELYGLTEEEIAIVEASF